MDNADDRLRIVVGLGNPGAKYDGTRHNVGFEVLNFLSRKLFAPSPRSKFDGQMTTLDIEGRKLILLWPLTYMNASGRCVRAVAQFYKINVERDLVVVCDDLSLPLGKLRIRPKGSAGGQKGLNDILNVMGTQSIARFRIGIDSPPPAWDVSNYVLGRFGKEERRIMDEAVSRACDAILDWCSNDISYCMNQFN